MILRAEMSEKRIVVSDLKFHQNIYDQLRLAIRNADQLAGKTEKAREELRLMQVEAETYKTIVLSLIAPVLIEAGLCDNQTDLQYDRAGNNCNRFNPVGNCVFNEVRDPELDKCLFCGLPEGRE